MHVGVPREIKNHEYRVGLTPTAVAELVLHGHQVSVEHDAGAVIGFSDDDYRAAGAQLASVEELFKQADMIVNGHRCPRAIAIARAHVRSRWSHGDTGRCGLP